MATAAELQAELGRLRGYASDTEFNEAYGDEGFKKELDTVVVVENLPVVPEAKHGKLLDFVLKIYSNIGEVVPGGVHMPVNSETKSTDGFAFVEFAKAEDAEKAVKTTDGWDFDTRHKLRVVSFEKAKAYTREPDDAEWQPPAPAQLKLGPQPLSWLLDETGRDQFAITWLSSAKQRQQEVLWSDARRAPQLEFAGDRDYVSRPAQAWQNAAELAWSPRGTYLATLAGAGVRLWSGAGFQYGHGLQHGGVREIAFAPTEQYALTWSGYHGNAHRERALAVWDVRTGALLRAFPQRRQEDDAPDMLWSSDGRFLARFDYDRAADVELVKVYEAPAMTLLDGRSLRAPYACAISWCPAGPAILAWWCPEHDNAPTSVQLVRMPSREVVRQRNLFNVETCTLVWHPEGAFLAVLAARSVRKRKAKGGAAAAAAAAGGGAPAPAAASAVKEKDPLPRGAAGLPVPTPQTGTAGYTIELYRLRDKGVPVEVLEVKERVRGLYWEPGPAGTRFALVYETPGAPPETYNIAFYSMAEAKGAALLFTLEGKHVNAVLWSPRGEYAVLAGERALAGRYEFFDVERRKSLATLEQLHAGGMAWDPSGRCVAVYRTSSLETKFSKELVDNGYQLYTFQGVKFFETTKHQMLSFGWRPRPASLLSEEDARDTAKNLKRFVARFQELDRAAETRKAMLDRLHRRVERDSFRALLARRHAEWLAARPARAALLGAAAAAAEEAAASAAAEEAEEEARFTRIESVYERVLEERVEVLP